MAVPSFYGEDSLLVLWWDPLADLLGWFDGELLGVPTTPAIVAPFTGFSGLSAAAGGLQ